MDRIYPLNALFFYRLVFMLLLLSGETMFMIKIPRKEKFALKAPLCILGCFVFALVFPIPTSNDFYSMMMFFMMFMFTYGMAFVLFRADWQMLLFLMICGYTTEHIGYEMYSTLTNFILGGDMKYGGLYNYDSLAMFSSPTDFVIWLCAFINTYWIIYVLFARRIEYKQSFLKKESFKILVIGALFIVIDIVLNSVTNYYSSIHYEKVYVGLISLINLVCCILGLLFIFEMYYRNSIEKEYQTLEEIRRKEIDQYQISKETIDMINIKVHDFKHQIRDLGKSRNIDDVTIDSINSVINIYDSYVKTSNEALNVILSEKSLACSKYGISFSCIADGSLLDFMSDEDIYSLFGNILDNSIEAVKQLNEGEKFISLKIISKGNIVSISEKNPFVGNVSFFDGLPVTSKENKNIHGFGLKSVKMITDKYKGTLEISTEGNIFIITLLFINNKKDL